MTDLHRKIHDQFLSIGLITVLVFAYLEIDAVWPQPETWGELLTVSGSMMLAGYVLLALCGLVVLAWRLGLLKIRLAFQMRAFLQWSVVVALIVFLAWFYLFSAWQTLTGGPWTQFLVAAGIAGLIHLTFFGGRLHQAFGWSDLILTLGLFLYPRLVREIRIIAPEEWASRLVILTGLAALLALVAILHTRVGERVSTWLLDRRGRLKWGRWALAAGFLLTPVYICYGISAGFFVQYPNLCFAAYLIALAGAAYVLCPESDRLVGLESVVWSVGMLVLIVAITRSLLLVVNDPFSLSWSEGNRLYDYSLVFGQNLYNHNGTIPDPYNSPGRFGLWGVLFLWQGLPIWAHRLWNVILLTLPSLIFAWVLTRKLRPPVLRTALFFWVAAFFIVVAPLHPPFMIVAILVAAFAFHPSPIVRGASLIAASFYAGLSRWTWIAAPAAWGALTDLLLYYPFRKGNWFQRLLPAALMALLGILPGLALNIANVFGFSTGEALTAQQPLLWYRLLPNATLGPGVLMLVLLTTGPLFALLIYDLWTHRLQLGVFQLLALWGSLLAFLAVGLVISTKIGGGGDLHNLDLYVSTLIFVTVLWLTAQSQNASRSHEGEFDLTRWPAWAQALACLLVILPVYPFTPFSSSAGYHVRLNLPPEQDASKALDEIRAAVADASPRGEVLFMDQRQLLTFGYVEDVSFVPEYEKKYMMDQALASNAAYFQPYYQDLEENRFALIVTEPLRMRLKEDGVFLEENDLWVVWVSRPTLCYYQPLFTDTAVGVQLLVPRPGPVDCEKFVE